MRVRRDEADDLGGDEICEARDGERLAESEGERDREQHLVGVRARVSVRVS